MRQEFKYLQYKTHTFPTAIEVRRILKEKIFPFLDALPVYQPYYWLVHDENLYFKEDLKGSYLIDIAIKCEWRKCDIEDVQELAKKFGIRPKLLMANKKYREYISSEKGMDYSQMNKALTECTILATQISKIMVLMELSETKDLMRYIFHYIGNQTQFPEKRIYLNYASRSLQKIMEDA